MIRIFIIGLSWIFVSTAFAQVHKNVRHVQSLDNGWHFTFNDDGKTLKTVFDEKGWETVNLPHDASALGNYSAKNTPQNGWLSTGTAWYKKEIEIDKDWLGKKAIITFDGVYMNSTVWLNGIEVGGRPYGFISFDCDISKAMKPGKNLLVVKVDNSQGPTARFYHGTGIYSHVNLKVFSPIHINTKGGVYVRTNTISDKKAQLLIDCELINPYSKDEKVKIKYEIFNSNNESVAYLTKQSIHLERENTELVKDSIVVENPTLWSVENPNLYRLVTTIIKKGKVIDSESVNFGIRSSRFDASTGFWLNDENIKLKGVCEHMEMMPVGLAVPDKMWEWRINTLKGMGCNAIRTSHHPFPPIFYQ